jgi:hypothetical protein
MLLLVAGLAFCFELAAAASLNAVFHFSIELPQQHDRLLAIRFTVASST